MGYVHVKRQQDKYSRGGRDGIREQILDSEFVDSGQLIGPGINCGHLDSGFLVGQPRFFCQRRGRRSATVN